jgi:alpha-methylacyl-CoA racemase
MVEQADALIEGFRPGVAERLGIGPDACRARNPKLVYGRMTGWGQDGPYAQAAGHDINYISLAGALAHFGRAGGKPTPPMNVVGDFGGGGMLLAFGVACALLEARSSGEGQVVDAAMVDGAAYLSTFVYKFRNSGMWRDERGTNMLDTGAPFYDTYRTKDGQFMSVGAIEPQFYAALLRGLGLEAVAMPAQMDQASWAATAARFAELFARKTRDEWSAIFDGTDACVAPVLGLGEAHEHPHNRARSLLIADHQDKREPAPAPRLSRTPGDGTRPLPGVGDHTRDVLGEFGFDRDEIDRLVASGAVA